MIVTLRSIIAAIVLFAVTRKYKGVTYTKADHRSFFIIGMLGYFLNMVLLQVGIAYTGASITSLISAMAPVTITFFAIVILKERFTVIKGVCLILVIVSAFVILGGASGQGEAFGIIAGFLSIITWGIATSFIRRMNGKFPPILITANSMLCSMVFFIPFGIICSFRSTVNVNLKSVAVLLYLGVICSCLTQFLWSCCLKRMQASVCSLFYPLQPIFSALLGFLLLGEPLKKSFFAGLAIMMVSTALSLRETIVKKF